MTISDLITKYQNDEKVISFCNALEENEKINLINLSGSLLAFIISAVVHNVKKHQLIILEEKEKAAYLFNDLEYLLNSNVLFFPESHRRSYQKDEIDNTNILLRTKVLNKLNKSKKPLIVISYPEAIFEKVITKKELSKSTYSIAVTKNQSILDLNNELEKQKFSRVDFVTEPGEYAIRGGIVDVFSFSNSTPFRVEFFGNEVESIRSFDVESQNSLSVHKKVLITPNIETKIEHEKRISLIEYMPKGSIIWCDDVNLAIEKIRLANNKLYNNTENKKQNKNYFINNSDFINELYTKRIIELSNNTYFQHKVKIKFTSKLQPSFNKKINLLSDDFEKWTENGFYNILLCSSSKQVERFYDIFKDIGSNVKFTPIVLPLHEGFIDIDRKLVCYTDHQIFERYHKFRLAKGFKKKQAITLNELNSLKQGDFVTHIDHGIGRFDGLKKIDVNNKKQEAIKLTYHDSDILYISIHSLHKITKYRGKDGIQPKVSKLGSGQWKKLKQKAKSKLKQLAYDLVMLYAKRKSKSGFSFSPDTYLQHELEASFIYEDTPDQIMATQEVKQDMENTFPMDRLICGDVGFGKTEVAIRAAFKSVSDSKQVAVLVPTTILAYQHFKTFSERFKNLPCNVDYINRFKSPSQQKQTLLKLKNAKIDILIGTHRIVSNDVEFNNLGLLIIDEEQKFGVGVKDKLKSIKNNVDTLTLTATPIPRTLQFSLIGARDFSVMKTPPPNRYPIQTEVHAFNEHIIRDAIQHEVSRRGQVFFINNRIENIHEVAELILRLCPDVKVGIGHGKLKGTQLEKLMINFVEGKIDVLVATSIIESGLDIPNANTIIINQANMFGLSDLHQMRGRVGRSNKKAFCYLLSPPTHLMSSDAKKRLQTLERFSDLGSGFNIAMKDLEIRGSGDLLGPEQTGFINEIGFDAYQKILNEAIEELKHEELKHYFPNKNELFFVKDCLIDTDFEVLIPDEYVNSVNKRLELYKELNELSNFNELEAFKNSLIDRFGELPNEVEKLLKLVELKWTGKKIGFKKVILKSQKLIGYFIVDKDSKYYQSEQFSQVLKFVQTHFSVCKMQEKNDKLSLVISNIYNVKDALAILRKLVLEE